MLGRVHLITDSRPGSDPIAQVRSLLPVATPDLTIQFRPADGWPDRDVYAMALGLAALCRTHGVQLLINDRLDIAMAVDADGVHVGALDLPVPVARRLLGPGKVVGATARTLDTAQAAMRDGASYVGVGPCYPTSTKDGLPPPLGPSGLARVAAHLPTIAIGGVTADRVAEVRAAGAHGIAVIGAVADAPQPRQALAELLAAV